MCVMWPTSPTFGDRVNPSTSDRFRARTTPNLPLCLGPKQATNVRSIITLRDPRSSSPVEGCQATSTNIWTLVPLFILNVVV